MSLSPRPEEPWGEEIRPVLRTGRLRHSRTRSQHPEEETRL